MKKYFPAPVVTSSAVIPYCQSIERGFSADGDKPVNPFVVPLNIVFDRPVNGRSSHALARILENSEQLPVNLKTIVEMTVNPGGISYAEMPNNRGKSAYMETDVDIIWPEIVMPKSSDRWRKIKIIYPKCIPFLVPDKRSGEFPHDGIRKPTPENPDSMLSPKDDFDYSSLPDLWPDSAIYPGSCVHTGDGDFVITCLHTGNYHSFTDKFGMQSQTVSPIDMGHDSLFSPLIGGVTAENQILYPKEREGKMLVWASTDLKLAYTYQIRVTKRAGQDVNGDDYRIISYNFDERSYGINGMPHLWHYWGDTIIVENTFRTPEYQPNWEEVTEDFFQVLAHGVYIEKDKTIFTFSFRPLSPSPFLPFLPLILPKIGSIAPAFASGMGFSGMTNIRTNIRRKKK